MEKTKNMQKKLILCTILLVLFFVSFLLGRYQVSLIQVLSVFLLEFLKLLRNITSFFQLFSIADFFSQLMTQLNVDTKIEVVVFQVRLPRVILACFVGACLSGAGASYQGVFQNPMAAPDILGASSGAAFGAALAILSCASSQMIMFSAFGFSLLSVLLAVYLSKNSAGNRVLGLVLAGIMVSSLLSAGTSFIKLVADPNDQLPAITYWLMGSLSGAKLNDILILFIPMFIGLVPLILFRWRINILTLGDDEARSIGVNPQNIRLLVIICATLITAASVAVSGMIGWVGLVVPHFVRRLVGNNYLYLFPTSLLFGAIFLLLIDDISRNLFATEIPLGILTAVIGAPFFIYLMRRKEEIV